MFPNEVTGYQVFADIRAHDEFSHIPIVAVSASDPHAAVPLTRQHGFSGFISKPIDVALFPQQIADVIDHKPVWYIR
jgi:CheY-like chemotaxis protein